MPIEFPCQQCQHMLRVPDESAGKKARCPQCSNVQDIPSSGSVAAPFPSPPTTPAAQPPDPFAAQQNPFALQQNPFADDPVTSNPYDSPTSTYYPTRLSKDQARQKIMGPAIALLIASVLALLGELLGIFAGIMSVAEQGGEEDDIFAFVMLGVMSLISIVIIIAATRMLAMKNYAFCISGVVCALLPCNCAWLLTIAFGIWAMVVLVDPLVRDNFT